MNWNRRTGGLIAACGVLLGALGSGAGYWLAVHRAHAADASQTSAPQKPLAHTKDDRKVLYWYDPMVPDQHFENPGKSPFMDMQLLAKYADDGSDAASIRIDPGIVQNLGLRTAVVERGLLANTVLVAGNVQWNERQIAIVQTRSAGFVERVYARAPGDVIGKGAPLADLLVPEWAGAQTEFLAMRRTGDVALTQAARERMKLLGMPAAIIAKVEMSGQNHPVVTISAPIGGVIQTLDVRVGMSLTAGMPLAKINGIDPIWLEAAVPEALADTLKTGAPTKITFTAYPGEQRTGKIAALLPQTNLDSRTIRVRIELPNHDGRLWAGMFAQVALDTGNNASALLIPSEAIIRTGTRTLVLLSLTDGHFRPAEIKTGQEASGKTVVLEGLREGERIVASGQFLIDSEASLSGVLSRLPSASTSPVTPPVATLAEADGQVEALSDAEITLTHGAIKSLGWDAMTMPFKLARPALVANIKVGDHVHFAFHRHENDFVIERIEKNGSRP